MNSGASRADFPPLADPVFCQTFHFEQLVRAHALGI